MTHAITILLIELADGREHEARAPAVGVQNAAATDCVVETDR